MNDTLSQTSSATSDSNVNPVPNPMPISVGPEGMSIVSSIETIVPTSAESGSETSEVVPVAENLRPSESAVQPSNNVAEPTRITQPPVYSPPIEKKVEVVDKTTGNEKLHHIEKPLNDLTTKADQEEEDFIKHVEEIHTLQ